MEKSSKTMEIFKQINNIPRESGNETGMVDYLCNFAKERNLEYEVDDFKNVMIKKKSIEGEIIILHSHTDMVCEKESDLNFDFSSDPINIESDGKFLKAKGTTLGADNGIGVAQILNILDSDIPCHIEAVFTAEEETTMNGAINFDKSKLKGKYLLSLDGFEENTVITESASFYDIVLKKEYQFECKKMKNSFSISLSGLLGGHSGFDIDKNRDNANILLCKILNELGDIEISNFIGGTKFNVIPSNSICEFTSDLSLTEIQERCSKFENVNVHISEIVELKTTLSKEESKTFIHNMINFKNGVIYYNRFSSPTTSINLAVVNVREGTIKIGMRSSKMVEEKECLKNLKEYSCKNNFEFIITGMQPGFESSENSKLISVLIQTCPNHIFGTNPVLKSVHIAVELGSFKEKIEGLDVAIISPNIQNAHSVNECVEIESIKTTDIWLTNFIKEFYSKEIKNS